MTYLLLGLFLFLGVHSLRMLAPGWRSGCITRLGPAGYKGLYSLCAGLGFALVVWGFAQAREAPLMLWVPPAAMRHLAALLTLVAFVLLAAAYVPRNAFKARLHHPMLLAVKTWAVAHLLANGTLSHVLLFGAFLVWAVCDFVSVQRRDRAGAVVYAPGSTAGTLASVLLGALAWALFAFWLHGHWIGIRPFG
ncbi:MAG: NnrU family protein [Rhodoferax sp.]